MLHLVGEVPHLSNAGCLFEQLLHLAAQRTVVRGCLLTNNTNAGVLLMGVYATAEGNHCRGNTSYGVRATTAGCMVIKNVVMGTAGSLNYAFSTGTRFGAVVNVLPSAAPVSVAPGAAAAGTFTTTDPNANLSY